MALLKQKCPKRMSRRYHPGPWFLVHQPNVASEPLPMQIGGLRGDEYDGILRTRVFGFRWRTKGNGAYYCFAHLAARPLPPPVLEDTGHGEHGGGYHQSL